MSILIKRSGPPYPTSVYQEMQDMIHASFDDVFGSDFTDKFFSIDSMEKKAYPRTDIVDEDNRIVFEVDIAGLTKADVGVDLKQSEDNSEVYYLTVSGGKKPKQQEDARKYLKKEIKRSSWTRSWTLSGKHYNTSKILVDVKDGMLIITVPKVLEEERKTLSRKLL